MKNRIQEVLNGRDEKLSQEALARKVGISARHMSRIILGESTPRADLALRIASELGTPVEDLFELVEEAA